MKSAMCLQFFEEQKFYASRASKLKLVLKLLALDAAKESMAEKYAKENHHVTLLEIWINRKL